MMPFIFFLSFIFFSISDEAKAEIVTAEVLATLCNYSALPNEYQKFAKNSCNGTIRAYLEYNSAMKVHFNLKVPFCLSPGGASLGGATSTFLGYLQSHPDALKKPASIVFAEAMASVAKC